MPLYPSYKFLGGLTKFRKSIDQCRVSDKWRRKREKKEKERERQEGRKREKIMKYSNPK
jgi:ribosomal protein L32E